MRLILSFAVLLGGCAPAVWRSARQENTPEAYETFAELHSNYPQAGLAMSRAEGMRWERAREQDTASAWAAYLRMHHNSPRADRARASLDAAAYREALAGDSEQALRHYLASHPEGAHAAEASQALDRLLWRTAVHEDTTVSYRRYLQQNPDGPQAAEAASRMQQRAYERAEAQDSAQGWRSYLRQFPSGSYVEQAQARLAQLTVPTVRVGIVLGESWRDQRTESLGILKRQVQKELVPSLEGIGFEVDPTIDLQQTTESGGLRDAFELSEGVGRLVLRVDDSKGEPFEPKGHETLMQAQLELFVVAKDEAMLSVPIQATTASVVYSVNERGLYESAASELAAAAASRAPELRTWLRE